MSTGICVNCGGPLKESFMYGGNGLCKRCDKQLSAAAMSIYLKGGGTGYFHSYPQNAHFHPYIPNNAAQILAHRDQILEQNRNQNPITEDAIKWANANIASLNNEQIHDICTKIYDSRLLSAGTHVVGKGFVWSASSHGLTNYPGVAVDLNSVVAVATTGFRYRFALGEMVILLTNDVLSPVSIFPVYKKDLGLTVNDATGTVYSSPCLASIMANCKNLRYPLMSFKELAISLENGDYSKFAENRPIIEALNIYGDEDGAGFHALNLVMTPEAIDSHKKSIPDARLLANYGYLSDTAIDRILGIRENGTATTPLGQCFLQFMANINAI